MNKDYKYEPVLTGVLDEALSADTELPLSQYMENTLNDVKTIIDEMNGSEDDKKHLLDTIWMLANSAKDGYDWTVNFGFATDK